MKRHTGKPTKRALLAAFLALALFAASCGDDDDTATDDTTPADDGSENGGDVEPQTLTIGVAYPDLEPFIEVNPAFSIGDPEEQAQAMLNGWREQGLLPMNGVDIEFAIRSFDPIDDTDKQAVCQAFAEEDEVFAVLAGRIYAAGAECLADRFDIPVISQDAGASSVYERAAPYYFTLRADESRVATNFVTWADEEGLFDDHTIGLYHDAGSEEAVTAFRDALAEAGHEIASEVETGGQGVGSEQDQVAVQRFQADGVTLVIPMIGGTSQTNFMTFADEQGYEPEYLDFDFSEHMSDVATLGRPASQQGGVQALTTNLIGDLEDGELAPESEECMSNYEEFSGQEFPRELPVSGEFTNVLITCSLGQVFMEAMSIMVESGEVSEDGLVAGLESISDFPVAYWDTISYSSDDHAGAESARPVVFDTGCSCWVPDGEFEEMPL